MNTLYLFRGLPGSGKSTAAWMTGFPVIEADDYFMKDGVYKFNPSEIRNAHVSCQDRVEEHLLYGTCCVANTFTMEWEIAPYREICKRQNAKLVIHSLYDGGLTDEELHARNEHGVPVAAIAAMRARWEDINE